MLTSSLLEGKERKEGKKKVRATERENERRRNEGRKEKKWGRKGERMGKKTLLTVVQYFVAAHILSISGHKFKMRCSK